MSRASRALPASLLAVAVGPAFLLPVHVAPPASAASLPDLKVSRLSAAPATVAPEGNLRVADKIVNGKGGKARSSTTSYYLSRDRVRSADDLLLGSQRVRRLAPGAGWTTNVSLVVPATTPQGASYVVACADAPGRVREAREANNCRATASPVTVQHPSGGGSGGGDGGGGGGGNVPTFPMTPNPLRVDSTLQPAQAVTQTALPNIDNQIAATATDGTTYTLDIPANALLGVEAITMTPLATVPDLPLSGGLVAGVQLEPHGLLLQKPATLTITSPDAGALTAQTAFLFHRGGDDFHLYPMDLPEPTDTKDTVRLSLTHFSTPGLGLATAADRNAVAARVPQRSQAQVEAVISEALRQERASVEAGNAPNPSVIGQVVATLEQYFGDVVRPRLTAAESNAELAATATAEGFGWARQMSLLDPDNPLIHEVNVRVEKIWKNALAHYWTRCTADHDLHAISVLMGIARQAALFGWAFQDEAWDKAQRCANLELRFDSLVTSSFTDPIPGGVSDTTRNGRWRVASTVEIPWLGSASGPLSHTQFSYSERIDYVEPVPDCPNRYLEVTGTSTSPGSLFAAVQLNLNPREPAPPGSTPPPVPLAKLTIFPGYHYQTGSDRPEETYSHHSHQCDDSTYTTTDSRWLQRFTSLRGGQQMLVLEVMPGEQSGEFLTTRTWTNSAGNGSDSDLVQETTTLELVHKPLL